MRARALGAMAVAVRRPLWSAQVVIWALGREALASCLSPLEWELLLMEMASSLSLGLEWQLELKLH